MKRFAATCMLFVLLVLPAFAQEDLPPFRWVDHGTFILQGRKYFGENAYEKAFDWDGQMSFGFRALSYNRESFHTYFMFQPVVARSYDRRIRVSGQVYHLVGSLRHTFSRELQASVSLIHLSTHITQDIEHPFYGDLPKLPEGLLDDANVVSIGFSGQSLYRSPLIYRWSLELQPIDVMLPNITENTHYARPVYLFLQGRVWDDGSHSGVITLESEMGDKKQSVAKLEAAFVFLNDARETRFYIFVDKFFAPFDVSSSPRLGFFPAEFALGLRFMFETE